MTSKAYCKKCGKKTSHEIHTESVSDGICHGTMICLLCKLETIFHHSLAVMYSFAPY